MNKEKLQKLWTLTLWFFLIFAIQHTFRDILTNILGIHNFFTEIGHRQSASAAWCGNFCELSTFPIEIFYMISSIYLLKKKEFGWLGVLMLLIVIPLLLQYFDIIIK